MAASSAPGSPGQQLDLLDFSKPLNVGVLDATVQMFYGAVSNVERQQASKVLQQFQEIPDAWTKVDTIMEQSSSQQTKFLALGILENTIKYRWGALPDEQREGVKNYITNLIIKLSSDEAAFRREKTTLNKLNIILVQVLKQEWPQKWPNFVPDIVGASKTSETLCENSMAILKLLSEEVFDFSKGELTQVKIRDLKNSLNEQFTLIHQLCLFVLGASQKSDLIRATLSTMHVYLSWVPIGYIFSSNMVEQLLKLFPQAPYRNVALQCLTEVASLDAKEFDPQFEQLYKVFIGQLAQIVPPANDIPQLFKDSEDAQVFIQNLAIFMTGFFKVSAALKMLGSKAHLKLMETSDENKAALMMGMTYLLNISFVESDEVLKICLDYWNVFVADVYSTLHSETSLQFFHQQQVSPNRQALFAPILSRLRLLMISKMAKPEEVIVVEDENGNIVRETMKDTDTLARYKTMHETLVYLCHLHHDDTEHQMLEKLKLQLSGAEWSWQGLNTLCWAIGSISGAMAEDQENRFLVTVIRDLLNLCEITRGKDNKAVIAANIMYVVGQYPRFLRNHWKFLKTVVNKLFEFMHETHPGVQDMACETFLKICGKCKRKFVTLQMGEHEAFIHELLQQLTATIQHLESHQIHMFYEAVGLMVGAEHLEPKRNEYLTRLMDPPNSTWLETIAAAKANPDVLKSPEIMRNVQNILQTNVSVCSSLGVPFIVQLSRIYVDMLAVYKMYSELISQSIATGGPHASKKSEVKMMRTAKKTALKLIETYVAGVPSNPPVGPHLNQVADELVPAMMDPILGDYARNVPDARDAEVLSLFAAIINKLGRKMEKEVPRIFEAVFQVTLDMITKNFEDFPEHRLQFFNLLRAITNNCFDTLYTLSPQQLQLVINSIIWAFRHTERNIAETGLHLLLEMLESFRKSNVATQFHQQYYLELMRETFVVMTDSIHKPGFKLHTRILHHLFTIVSSGVIKAPLWDAEAKGINAYPSNAAFVQEFVSSLLATSFPNMRPQQIHACVSGMLHLQEYSAFKGLLRDFLVQTKSFSSQDNADLFAEETAQKQAAEMQRMAAIPGMVQNHVKQEDDMDN